MTVYTFKATKSADQSGIANDTYTAVGFDTAALNQGGYYNATTGEWTPPAGNVIIEAQVTPTGVSVSTGTIPNVRILKNGSPLSRGSDPLTRVHAFCGSPRASLHDVSNGTDVYTVDFKAPSAGTITIVKSASQTFFQGTVIA